MTINIYIDAIKFNKKQVVTAIYMREKTKPCQIRLSFTFSHKLMIRTWTQAEGDIAENRFLIGDPVFQAILKAFQTKIKVAGIVITTLPSPFINLACLNYSLSTSHIPTNEALVLTQNKICKCSERKQTHRHTDSGLYNSG